jgi:hypothetical protein
LNSKKGSKTHNPRFCITFSLKNEALCKNLHEIIGFGFIRYKLKDNACVLVVSPWRPPAFPSNVVRGSGRAPRIKKNCKFNNPPLGLTVAKQPEGGELKTPYEVAGDLMNVLMIKYSIDSSINIYGDNAIIYISAKYLNLL